MFTKRINILFYLLTPTFFLVFNGCSKYEIDYGNNIHFVFDEGLNDNPNYRLEVNEDGYFIFPLTTESQNIQRISVKLLDGDKLVLSKCCGYNHSISWYNNLFWWLLEGDTVVNITKTYFNPFTGEIQYINLPPLVNYEDVLVPTINPSSITDQNTGRTSTVIGPIGEMRGDTMKVFVTYNHQITKQKSNSKFYEIIGSKMIIDSVTIILN